MPSKAGPAPPRAARTPLQDHAPVTPSAKSSDGHRPLTGGETRSSTPNEVAAPVFDVLIFAARKDSALAETIAKRLEREGLTAWWSGRKPSEGGPPPGTRTLVALVGPNGVSSYALREIDALRRRHEIPPREFAVLLPGVPLSYDPGSLPGFLRDRPWVDLRGGLDGPGWAALVREIRWETGREEQDQVPIEATEVVSESVRTAAARLTGAVSATAFVQVLFELHPEYGERRAGSVKLDDRTETDRLPAQEWIRRVRPLFDDEGAPQLHGRLVVLGLALLVPTLRQGLEDAECLAPLVAEIEARQPLLATLSVQGRMLWTGERQQQASPRRLAMTLSTRQVLTHAAAMLETRRDEATDIGAAKGAVLLGALHYATEDASPTMAVQLLAAALGDRTDPSPLLDDAGAALQVERVALSGLPPISDAALELPPLATIVSRAEELGKRTRADGVHLRHLLAETLSITAPTVPDEMFTALGISLQMMRGVLRRAVEQFEPEEPSEVWDAILAEASDAFDLAGGLSRDAVDPNRGIALNEDHLGVGTYVAMLAAVIADSRTPEPLSIGLFGEWGSGKSYFMGLLREQVDQLSAHGAPYYTGISQIGFNAWHYADTNIWASLGDEIFEQLAGPRESPEKQRDRLRAELADRLQRRKELQAATERAQEETRRLSEALEQANAARRTSARSVAEAAARSPTLKRELDRAWRRMGINDTVQQGELLGDEVRGTVADVDSLRQTVKGRRGIVLMIMAAVTVILVAVSIAAPTFSRWLSGGTVAALTVLLSTAITYVVRVRSGLQILHAATTDITSKLDAGQRKAVEARVDKLRQAEANERVLQAQHDQVVDRVGELGRELAELSPGQRLYQFVTERSGSEDYRRHLGLISTVRKDFQQLVALLKDWREQGDDANAGAGVDRIVLYIDDLDRCSPQQVVEVLQAVHLLLALDLFVVVVGVDPRWLLRSLQSEYDRVLTSDGAEPGDAWQASPHDYLEKIFNIPFSLPKMNPGSFGALLESFASDQGARTNGGQRTEATQTASSPAAPETPTAEGGASDGAQPAVEGWSDSGGGTPVETAPLLAEEHSEAATASAGAAQIEVRPLTKPELRLLASLAPLVETPREAKRLVNLYRLVRSTRNLRPASRFLGDQSRPGEYEAVVILLGLLSGHGRLLENVLTARPTKSTRGGLVHRDAKSSWLEFAEGIAPRETRGSWRNDVVGEIPHADVAQWQQLHDGLINASAQVTLDGLDAFQFWAPRIARFSFLLSPYVAEDAELRSPEIDRSPVES